MKNTFLRLGVLSTEKLALADIQKACEKYLPKKTKRALSFHWDCENPNLWLKIILKIDLLLEIKDINGIPKNVAVGFTQDVVRADANFQGIISESFSKARKALGIDRHWIILTERDEYYPSDGEVIDICIESIDSVKECLLINFQRGEIH
jgi:hypothetical protein